jgi:G3E family GTPase
MMTHPYLLMRYRLDGVITAVDAVNGKATLDAHPEAVKQAAVADRIVLTKTDLATFAQIDALRGRLAELNAAAPVLEAAKGEATPDQLFGCGLYDPEKKTPDVKRWLKEEAYAGHADDHAHYHDRNRHDDHIRSFVLTADRPIPGGTLDMFFELLRATHGDKLLRMKGIVQLAETPETPLVVHGVQHVFHPPARLPRWPDADRRTRIVFIVRDLPERTVRELFEAFLGAPAPDRPDHAALTDNPLVPFGGR